MKGVSRQCNEGRANDLCLIVINAISLLQKKKKPISDKIPKELRGKGISSYFVPSCDQIRSDRIQCRCELSKPYFRIISKPNCRNTSNNNNLWMTLTGSIYRKYSYKLKVQMSFTRKLNIGMVRFRFDLFIAGRIYDLQSFKKF